jgi:hypothetical protein
MRKIGSALLIIVLCCALASQASERREISKPHVAEDSPLYFFQTGNVSQTEMTSVNKSAISENILAVNPNSPQQQKFKPSDNISAPANAKMGKQESDNIDKILLDPPPNDNCVDLVPSALTPGTPLVFTGDGTEATNDCGLVGYPEVWEAFSISEELNVVIDYCGTSPAQQFYIGTMLTQCPCATSINATYMDIMTCIDGNLAIHFNNLPAGTYYFPVFSYYGTIGQYTIHINATEPPPPPPNDNCESVIPTTLNPNSQLTFSGTGAGGTNDCPLFGFPEVWEAFTISEELNVTIDFCGTTPALYGMSTVLTQCQCESLINNYGQVNWGACEDGNGSITFRHLPAGTYYYPVYAGIDAAGPYTMHVTSEVPPPGPANDNCADAEAIGEVQNLEYSNFEATFDGPGVCVTTANVWYLYTPSASGEVVVDLCAPYEQYNLDTKMAIYESAGCPDAAGQPIPRMLQGGETIATATSINDPLPIKYYGTTNGYNNDYILSSCTFESAAADVVYSFAPSFSGSVIITLCGSDYDTALEIVDQNENVLACNDDYCDLQSGISNFQVTSGQTYFIIISGGYLSPSGNYVLNMSAPDYTLIGCNENYCGSNSQIIIDAELGHQYLIEIGGESGRSDSLGNGRISIYPIYPPPPNNDCSMADYGGTLIAGDTIHFEGNCTGATIDCPAVDDYPEVWISFTTPATLDLILDFCGSPFRGMGYTYLTDACPCSGISRGDLYGANCPNGSYETAIYWYGLPAGTYYYPVSFLTGFSEGPYSINVYGTAVPDPQTCSEDAIYGQAPSTPNNPWIFYLSDLYDGSAVADDFTGLADSVRQITWWGLTADQDFAPCDPETMPFEITFCHNGGGIPGEPTDTVATYNVTVTPEVTGFTFQGYAEKKFVATLNPPLRMNRGWVIIQGNGQDNCLFLWQDGLAGNAMRLNLDTHDWEALPYNLAFCLDSISVMPGGCNYAIGDANASGVLNGLDVTYSVGYFKGGSLPPYSCECTPGNTWFVAGDVNGSCSFNGLDVTYMVSYFKGGPPCHGCADCLPIMGILSDPTLKPTTSTIGDDAQP